MGDRYTEVRETGYLQNIMNSIKGVAFGVILFLLSFVVLWWNEGRIDMSKVAATSIPLNAATIDTAAEGKLVSVTGTLESNELVGDPQYVKPGSYIALTRKAEMYAWVEKKSTKTTRRTGGSRRTETTYSYTKEWTDRPEDASSFRHPEGHANPSPSISSQTFRAREATIGAYRLNPQSVILPRPSFVPITSEVFIPAEKARLEGDYIFMGKGTLQTPEIGDMRIGYEAVESGITATLFGELAGNSIEPYYYKGKNKLYRAIAGPREAAIAQMASEHRVITWLLRGAGFAMMWVGLALFFGPINAVLDVLPILGSASRFIFGLAMLGVALCLSIITILVSKAFHNPLLSVGIAATAFFALWIASSIRKKGLAEAKVTADSEPTSRRDDNQKAPRQTGNAETITFACEQCGKQYTVKASIAGRKVKCKQCGHRFIIPRES